MSWIIDGYNLLLVSGRGASQAARAQLLRDLARLRGERGGSFLVVFDAREGAGTWHPTTHPGVRVEWARDADAAFIERLRRSRRPATTTVVTCDRALAAAARDLGARSEEVEDFLARTRPPRGRRHRPPPDDAGDKPHQVSASEVEYWLRAFGEDGGADGPGDPDDD